MFFLSNAISEQKCPLWITQEEESDIFCRISTMILKVSGFASHEHMDFKLTRKRHG
ncbi:hypothetical protein SAMN05519104_4170 [Rhizobiales bacterium GAS188]|nr:hypothetical protein SAMN05519104_4170 [Rhizobiales bacterium GAS188]